MAGYDAKNGRTKSEFRDICQNKLLQLSLSIIHHFSVYFLCFSQQEKLMVSLLNFCCVQYQLSKHSLIFFFFLTFKKFILLSEGFIIYKSGGAICIDLNAISWCDQSQFFQLKQESSHPGIKHTMFVLPSTMYAITISYSNASKKQLEHDPYYNRTRSQPSM